MNREDLAFESAVIQKFAFIGEYGFLPTQRSLTTVRFESDKVFVEIFHGLKDYEVGIRFGSKDRNKTLSFRLFLKHFFPGSIEQLGNCIADTPAAVIETVTKAAQMFQATGEGIVDADMRVFDEMDKVLWWDADK